MTISSKDIESELSYSYFHAVASAAGFTRNERKAPTSKVGDISELKRPQHQTVQG